MTDAYVPIAISGGDLSANMIPFGTTLVALPMAGRPHPLILGKADLA